MGWEEGRDILSKEVTLEKWPEENERHMMKLLGKEHFTGKRKQTLVYQVCLVDLKISKELSVIELEQDKNRTRWSRNNWGSDQASSYKPLGDTSLYYIHSTLFVSMKLKLRA